MKVTYTGSSNFREFSAKDLETLGIEDGKKHRFEKGVPQEVDDEVGQTLVEGNFNFVEVSDEEDAQKATKRAAKKAAKDSDKSTGKSSQSDGTGTGGSTTTGATAAVGNGSSTPGTTR